MYALRPPALDDLGLVAAIREQATRSAVAPLQVTVQAPESLPVLPAAVEVAAYRIVQEALTNVVRHAGARTSVVRLACPSDGEAVLRLMIEDDGRGLPADLRAGVGLTSMRERAAELGGTWSITSGDTGTRVEVVLPLGPGQHRTERRRLGSAAPDVSSCADPETGEEELLSVADAVWQLRRLRGRIMPVRLVPFPARALRARVVVRAARGQPCGGLGVAEPSPGLRPDAALRLVRPGVPLANGDAGCSPPWRP